MNLSFERDSLVSTLGNDIIEIENMDITVYAHAWPASLKERNDAIVIRRNKNIYVKGHAGSDDYYIHILPKLSDREGHVVIEEIPSNTDKNIIYICGVRFANTTLKKAQEDSLLLSISSHEEKAV